MRHCVTFDIPVTLKRKLHGSDANHVRIDLHEKEVTWRTPRALWMWLSSLLKRVSLSNELCTFEGLSTTNLVLAILFSGVLPNLI